MRFLKFSLLSLSPNIELKHCTRMSRACYKMLSVKFTSFTCEYRNAPGSARKMAKVLGESLRFPTSGRVARNRLMKAALSERQATWHHPGSKENGVPTQTLTNIYDKWGHGGWGVILTGNVIVDQNHLESAGNMIIEKSLDTPWRREAYKQVATAAKTDGALSIVQLGHAGRQTHGSINAHPFSASDVRLEMDAPGFSFGQPVTLTVDQIKTEVVDKLTFAAKYCAEVGFDGVELHAAHGYLLSQFLSPTTNKRTDRYGGSVENRMRVIAETYQAIRSEVPKDFVVGVKLNSVEFQNDGLDTKDAAAVSQGLEKLGFDFIELSGGTYERWEHTYKRESTQRREAYFIEFSEQIVSGLSKIVVYLTGGFRSAAGMCEAIKDGATQGIGLGRPGTQEPDIASKLVEGKSSRASKSLLKIDDYNLTLSGSFTQMAQMGREPFSGDVCKGIMDLGDEETLEKFKEALSKHRKECAERASKGEYPVDVCDF